MAGERRIVVRVNGVSYDGVVEPRKLLVDFIRENLGLTGTHVGCEHGVCGSCTILLDGEAVRSCLMFAVQADGAELLTVEGLAEGRQLHPIQEAFVEEHGLQCGFCTPGILMSAYELLQHDPNPSDETIKDVLGGHLCRCTGYQDIVESIRLAAMKMGTLAAHSAKAYVT